MNSVFITAIICATVTALAWMVYDLRRRRIDAVNRKAKTRTIEKEVLVEVPVYQSSTGADPDPEAATDTGKHKGSLRGYYVGKDGIAQEITGRSGKDEQQSRNAGVYKRNL